MSTEPHDAVSNTPDVPRDSEAFEVAHFGEFMKEIERATTEPMSRRERWSVQSAWNRIAEHANLPISDIEVVLGLGQAAHKHDRWQLTAAIMYAIAVAAALIFGGYLVATEGIATPAPTYAPVAAARSSDGGSRLSLPGSGSIVTLTPGSAFSLTNSAGTSGVLSGTATFTTSSTLRVKGKRAMSGLIAGGEYVVMSSESSMRIEVRRGRAILYAGHNLLGAQRTVTSGHTAETINGAVPTQIAAQARQEHP